MNLKSTIKLSITYLIFFAGTITAQYYPDQHYVLRIDSIFNKIETNEGLKLSDDGKSIMLQDDVTEGYIILSQQNSEFYYNQGLPSWNGTAPGNYGSFKIQMRFPYGTDWSPWLTVGFWKSNIWSSYGTTTYGGGYIDYDYVKLNSYSSSWQFKIIMKRTSAVQPSPTIHKLSFFISDSRTTNNVDITQIVNDNPEAIFIPTEFIYQYGVDPVIGGDICSPTTVSMILKSYDIEVDPYQFALDTRDPHFNMFGIWPRVVQNASEFGLDGAVTRYRTWSEARDILADGGRIAMSVGQPLYAGHLFMLAGFTSDGRPIVHDPAKSSGYSYVYNKTDISKSWFEKGGISYTFFPADDPVSVQLPNDEIIANDFKLYQNYPNPFNPTTKIQFYLSTHQFTTLTVYDMLGREIAQLIKQELQAGLHEVNFNAGSTALPSGTYFYRLQSGNYTEVKKMSFIK
ncbi:MAG: T9SS type A sorting domain-containing protein [Ignavibacteriaceae bacterium]